MLPNVATWIVIFIWSTSFSISKPAIEALGVWPFRLYTSIAALVCLIFVSRGALKKIFEIRGAAEITSLLLLTLCNGVLVPVLNNYALLNTKASNVIVLVYTMPAFASLIECLHSRKVKLSSVISMTLCASGALVYLHLQEFGRGEGLILLSAVIWAIGTHAAGKAKSHVDRSAKLIIQVTLSLVLALVVNFSLGNQLPLLLNQLMRVNPSVWLAIFYSGILNSPVVFYLWYYVIENKGAEKASYFVLLVPLIGVCFSAIVLHEGLTYYQIIGCLLIISSIAATKVETMKLFQRHGSK